MGRLQEARQALGTMEKLMRHEHYYPAPTLAVVYSGMNMKAQAFTWLEKAYSARSNSLTALKVDHVYDPLRGDPRLQDLRRVGLLQ